MTKKRVKLLLYRDNEGFKKLSVTRGQLRLLQLLYLAKKLDGVKFFDMREVSPMDEINKEYVNVFNIDFSFTRVDTYFEEGLVRVKIVVSTTYWEEWVSLDRLDFLRKDSILKGYRIEVYDSKQY